MSCCVLIVPHIHANVNSIRVNICIYFAAPPRCPQSHAKKPAEPKMPCRFCPPILFVILLLDHIRVGAEQNRNTPYRRQRDDGVDNAA